MYALKGAKTVGNVLATGATAGETLTQSVDTLGYDYVEFALLTSSVATNKQPTVLQVAEGDTTSAYATWSAAIVGGTAANTSGFFTIPAGNTSHDNLFRIGIDTRARKRYLKLSVSPATTVGAACVTTLLRAGTTPTTTTAAGCDLYVHG